MDRIKIFDILYGDDIVNLQNKFKTDKRVIPIQEYRLVWENRLWLSKLKKNYELQKDAQRILDYIESITTENLTIIFLKTQSDIPHGYLIISSLDNSALYIRTLGEVKGTDTNGTIITPNLL